MSSISEQLHTNSSFFNDVPMKPSARLMYSFWLASATLLATMVSNSRMMVRRGYLAPYLVFKPSYHSMVYSGHGR